MPKQRLSDITCQQLIHNLSTADKGPPLAQAGVVPHDDETVAIIKEYPRPEFNRRRAPDDIVDSLKSSMADLLAENACLKDRIRRLEEEVQSEIKMLTAALRESQETVDQVRRRISRLRGSLEYPGRTDYKQ